MFEVFNKLIKITIYLKKPYGLAHIHHEPFTIDLGTVYKQKSIFLYFLK
jgi:hypothetical protein